MIVNAFPAVPMVLIDVAFGGLMLLFGFAAAWFLLRASSKQRAADSEKARDALNEVRELAGNVARDVGAHSHRMHAATTELTDLQSGKNSGDLNEVVLRTVSNMISANEQLQSQLASAEERLQKQAAEIEHHLSDARTDKLTKINNRRAFDDEIDRLFAAWTAKSSPFSMYLIDVDHFKKFNDTHGHQAGDEVLRGVAKTLQGAARKGDIVCRYGGEEFAVLLPGSTVNDGKKLAEIARRAIQDAMFNFDGVDLRVTASIGVAEVVASDDIASLIRRSDEALYAGKEAGRNNAHYHDGNVCRPVIEAASDQVAIPPSKIAKQPARESNSPAGPTESPRFPTPTLDRLPGHDTFTNELRRRISEAQRFGLPISIVLVNVDKFTQLVTKFGQPVGDVVLDTVAQYLEILLRDMDLLAIYADGAFAILLPGTPVENATTVGERVRDAMSDCVIPLGSSQLRLSVTGGIAGALKGDDTQSLIDRAESALSAARARGAGAIFLNDGKRCSELQLGCPAHA